MTNSPLMPMATAVWLVENTTLTFKQISEFCNLHEVEVQGIADGEVAKGIMAYNPIIAGQLTREEIGLSSKDENRPLQINHVDIEISNINKKIKKYVLIFLIFIFPFIMISLISGGSFGLEWVETNAWGGLSLTFIISIFAILFCFPIGLFLALGRRSSYPVIRYSSIGFIEFWRGVPLITVLFMASVMLPMFLPEDTYMDKLVRVIIAITLFESAYMAEVVRGGLQALPKGQYDAGKSLGMGYWRMNLLIIMPQALKLVIPGVANTFLALVKDTPLILVVGLLELIGMIDMAKTNPKWLGFAAEGYVFAGFVFWIICYSMSRYSQSLERKYKTDR